MANPNHRTTAEWFWLSVSVTAGIGFMIALLSYTGAARWAVVLMAVLGSLCFSKAAYDLHLYTAPLRIGTPIRTLLVLTFIWGGMGLLAWRVLLVNTPANIPQAAMSEADAFQPPGGLSGDVFPLLKDTPRPYEKHSYGTSEGNLRERMIGIADAIDGYPKDHPEPSGSPTEISKWTRARSDDFRANILESLVEIHDEMKWFHYRDSVLDMLLEEESYKEQINEMGGIEANPFHPNPKQPRHKVEVSPQDLNEIAQRLRILAQQMKTP